MGAIPFLLSHADTSEKLPFAHYPSTSPSPSRLIPGFMVWLQITLIVLLGLCGATQAQFQFFEQMFGHGHQQQQQQQRHQQASSTSQWTANADIVPCSDYLCPDTLVCVSNPIDCPCPDVQDVKCLIPDAQDKGGATVLCVRGREGCQEAERLMRRR
ncbi:hypothetical protein GLOTRDRAFT_136062 [Gloeophyllum trabeum ATCC 11539]|uniref:Long chronological lifespan protein 2 n=1 Tax=Gloeophyllum trabeum (strain ATCC 11539 / FP-39264 / Madison 617) TaxID=670483 RepID=S7RW62_GLOTA|nr:uncharacterized protein GLOTRDRAFT_136062 [Gloeophyllum trabeum ATCC 11539]EPQ59100.1 hypothetical protein GLOTRDRAFT_136062 [Gloeophyllum trabeum ATCC 11539]